MTRSPEEMERMKNVALTGVALAAAGLALRYRKPIGERIISAEIWEKSESIVVDWIGSSREKSIRLFGNLVRNAQNEITGVEDVQIVGDDGSGGQIQSLEEAFADTDEPV